MIKGIVILHLVQIVDFLMKDVMSSMKEQGIEYRNNRRC